VFTGWSDKMVTRITQIDLNISKYP